MKEVDILMNPKIILLFFLFLLLALPAHAEFNVAKAYTYLVSKESNGSYNSNVFDTSLALLALNAVSRDVSKEASYLKSQENVQNCWPKQSCNVKDTVFAAVALASAGNSMDAERLWLEKAQSVAMLSGIWYLEIATAETGSCRLSYMLNNQTVEKEVKVVEGVFPECGNTTFYNINKCLAQGMINSLPSLTIDVNCDSLSSVNSLTILYQTGNSFYLVDEDQSTRASLMIKNGCFGKTYKSACDYEASLYANWALSLLQSQADTLFYLKQSYDSSNPLHSSILYLVTKEQAYSKELVNRQRNDGSWNANVYQTSFAVLALKDSEASANIDNAKKYFGTRQLADYSLGNVADTAIALYAAFGDASNLPECFGNEKKLCESQAGVCMGSYETCKNNTFEGCTDEIYKAFNSSYLPVESSSDCDNIDNDCDGNVDTGCECSIGNTRPCGMQYGVCNGTIETCGSDGVWPGCDYSKISNYEEVETSCKDALDNDCDDMKDSSDDDCEGEGICNSDGTCDADNGEDADNCPEDCPVSDICNSDGVCDGDQGEDYENCPEDCEDTCSNGIQDEFEEGKDCGGICSNSCEKEGIECNSNGECEVDFEDADNCPEDCYCGDEICDNSESYSTCESDCPEEAEPYCGDGACDEDETLESCPKDCTGTSKAAETGPSSTIWYILLLLIVLGAVGLIIYKKKFKKGGVGKITNIFGSKSSSKPPMFESMFSQKKEQPKTSQKPFVMERKPSQKSDVEKELEKSISEAKKLIEKEK